MSTPDYSHTLSEDPSLSDKLSLKRLSYNFHHDSNGTKQCRCGVKNYKERLHHDNHHRNIAEAFRYFVSN